jgi:hypothetical protein
MGFILRSSPRLTTMLSRIALLRGTLPPFSRSAFWGARFMSDSLEIMTAVVDDGHRPPARNRGSKPEFST